MKPATNTFLAAVAVISLIAGASNKTTAIQSQTNEIQRQTNEAQAEIIQHYKTAPVQRPTIDVRTADWSPIKLPSTVQNVAYNAGDCTGGSCSILGLARRTSAGEASGPVRRVFSGLAERRPLRRLLGRLRCR